MCGTENGWLLSAVCIRDLSDIPGTVMKMMLENNKKNNNNYTNNISFYYK